MRERNSGSVGERRRDAVRAAAGGNRRRDPPALAGRALAIPDAFRRQGTRRGIHRECRAGQRRLGHDGSATLTLTLPRSLPEVLGLVPAGNVVVVEAGLRQGEPSWVSGNPVVTEYIAVDLATGHEVWTLPAGMNPYTMPPIAVSGDLLLTGDLAGAVTARVAATGKVVWHDPRPKACGPAPGGGLAFNALGIAADGPLAVVSFGCSPRVIVQRLDAATGRPLWT
jgi:hypothetical protein